MFLIYGKIKRYLNKKKKIMPITIKDLTNAFTKNLEEIIIQEMINSNESLNLEDFVRDNIPDIVKLNEERVNKKNKI